MDQSEIEFFDKTRTETSGKITNQIIKIGVRPRQDFLAFSLKTETRLRVAVSLSWQHMLFMSDLV